MRDAPGFEEWLLLQRQQMHTLAAEGWQSLTNHYIQQGEKGFGLIAVRRLLGLEPWRESAHQQLMRLLMRSGQRGAALAQYEICLHALAEGFTESFSPSGNLLVSGATDETIRFWDVESGACVNSLYAEGPYSGMNITGVTGLTEAPKASLVALGAVEGNAPRRSINPSSIATMLKAPNNVGQISLSWS